MFYPAHLDLVNRNCLVVGGGTVAERKVVSKLISCGKVTVISPENTELVEYLAKIGSIQLHKRQFQEGDTKGYYLVCAATDDTTINTTVFEEAHEEHKIRLVNVVDVIPQCSFAAASVVTDGDLVISISTSGKSPATSRRIREHLEEMLNTFSLYTLGYEDGNPIPIDNQGLPYPVYLLLEGRKCVVLCDNVTSEIDRYLNLLRQCGADVVISDPDIVRNKDIRDAFLVISEKRLSVDALLSDEFGFIYECLDDPQSGTHSTPRLVIDDNLIISISAKNGSDYSKVDSLHRRLKKQFENNGYGAFLDVLGGCRPEVLDTFPTSKIRGDFFERLIGYIVSDSDYERCCLSLDNLGCDAECMFNWVRNEKIEQATDFIANELSNQRTKLLR